jgi:hypothetical protein
MPEEFFVGYLPTPPRLRRTLIVIASCLVAAVGAIGITIAATQNDPGSGKWNLDQLDTFEGVLIEHPYPMLHTEHGTLLLVSEGKRGAAQRVAGMNGKRITLHGHTLTRGNLHLLELDDTAITSESKAVSAPSPTLSTETITLTGEIIDPKCFSGAMKPGQGKTHKACAILCIRGGIPPVFLNSDGSTLLLVDGSGDALSGDALETILPYVGDLVEIHGRTGTAGQLRTLVIQSIERP